MRVERLSAWPGPPFAVAVAVGVGEVPGAVAVAVAVGVGEVPVAVAVEVAVAVGVGEVPVAVAVGVGVNVAVGVGDVPQAPKTLNTMCMFGNPTAAVVVGTVIPHAVALI